MAQKKKRKAKNKILSEFGNFPNPREEKHFGVFDENGKITKRFPPGIVRCKCKLCRFEGPVWAFKSSFSKYHDLRCPECGTAKIDTSSVKMFWGKYGFGKDNRLKKTLVPKNIKPDYGD